MRLALGCDHAGFALKGPLSAALEADGHDILDLGTFSAEPVDYPDFARAVGQAVLRGFVEAGVLVCGSGVGASIAANKIRGIRAALCHDVFTARQSREDDDANVLCLGARVLDEPTAVEVTRAWIEARFSGEERHTRPHPRARRRASPGRPRRRHPRPPWPESPERPQRPCPPPRPLQSPPRLQSPLRRRRRRAARFRRRRCGPDARRRPRYHRVLGSRTGARAPPTRSPPRRPS
jgi:ribose 5-phosphate isomerase B